MDDIDMIDYMHEQIAHREYRARSQGRSLTENERAGNAHLRAEIARLAPRIEVEMRRRAWNDKF